MVEEFMRLLQNFYALDHTIIIVTHDSRIVANYAKTVVVMDEGKIIAALPTQEFLKQAQLQIRAAFVSPTERMN